MKFYCYDRLSFYVQGRWKNLRYVLTATCMPNGDGIDWPLREETFKYDLTVSASLPCLGNLLQVHILCNHKWINSKPTFHILID